ncbi:MAG: TonB-dependent receptor, partial [Rhodothermales bacterium]|nr:TonB-dependent receptor [Rhodothermales bacterium]
MSSTRYYLPTLVLLIAALLVPVIASAQTTGKIRGTVVDAADGTPLPGVNVSIDGTTQGTVTDIDGQYIILRVSPGTYGVRASFIGFAPVTQTGISVQVNKTSFVDFQLREEVFEGEEIVVTADRPIVQVDRTTTSSVLDGEQLASLPVTNIREAIDLQAGIVDGHFRGGRTGEVGYLVNGVPINNAFSQDASFEIEQNMVENLEVISGVFNAEYGQALSGIVNIVTKDVADKWSGNVLGYVGALASSRDIEFVRRDVAAGNNLSASDFSSEFVSYWDAADMRNVTDVQASIGGPLIRDRLGIQTSVRYLNDKSHFLTRDLFSPADSSQLLNSGLPEEFWQIESTGSGDFVSRNSTERLSINGTMSYNLSSAVKVDYNVFTQGGTFTPYAHFYKYVPDAVNKTEFFNQTHILGLRFLLSERSFANLSYSFLRDKTDVRLYESENDPRYVSSQLSSLQGVNSFAVGGNDLFTSDQLTQTHTVVGDYTIQANNVHQAKVGFSARLHNIDNRDFGIERSFRTGFQPQASPDQFADNRLNTNPKELAAYVQDKMEFENLIVNAGIRFDYFDPDYDIPIDWAQAELAQIPDPSNPDQTISNRVAADAEYQFSPRVGIAFPISETGVMRFSAGLFFQVPAGGLLYTNPEYEVNPASSVNSFGNAGISPERTLSFEVGLQQGITDRIGMELTVFSKDVRNLLGQEILRNPNGDFAIRWINRDYGTIRGITASMFQRGGGTLAWTVDYTLQFAEGTSSSAGEAFGRQQSG